MRFRTIARTTALVLVALCATAAVALAATPKLGGTYTGQAGPHHPLKIKVNRHRDRHGKLRGTLTYCGLKAGIVIVRGHFGVHLTTAGGAVSTFRAHGGWVTPKLVQGRIDLDFGSNCQGQPGNFSATLR